MASSCCRLSLLLLLVFLCLPGKAEYTTPGSGMVLSLSDLDILSGTVVDSISGGYQINDRLTISRSDQLVIDPGTFVRINIPFLDPDLSPALIVDGSVEAVGTAAAPIIFEVSPFHRLQTSWMGFYNRPNSGPTHYRHCTFLGGDAGIMCRQSSPEIQDCTFSGQQEFAIGVWSGASPTIIGNVIETASASVGISLAGNTAGSVVEGNVLRSLNHGILLTELQGCTLLGNRVEAMRSAGIAVSGGNVTLEDTYVSDCADGVVATGTGTLIITDSEIRDCTFTGLLQMDGSSGQMSGTWITGNGVGEPAWGDGSTGGIQFLDNASADLGSSATPGYNCIYSNPGGNLLNFTENTILAIGNYWDSAVASEVHETLWDMGDDSGDEDGSGFVSGPVLIEPIAGQAPPATSILQEIWQAY